VKFGVTGKPCTFQSSPLARRTRPVLAHGVLGRVSCARVRCWSLTSLRTALYTNTAVYRSSRSRRVVVCRESFCTEETTQKAARAHAGLCRTFQLLTGRVVVCCKRPILTGRIPSSFCRSVSPLVTSMYCGKTATSIETPFWVVSLRLL